MDMVAIAARLMRQHEQGLITKDELITNLIRFITIHAAKTAAK